MDLGRPLLALCCACVWSVGCAEDSPPAAPGGGSNRPAGGSLDGQDAAATQDAAPEAGTPTRCPALDLLFVVDNSVSMIEEQAALAAHAGAILDTLDGVDPPVDYQIGVAHSSWANPSVYGFVSPGSEGALLQTAGMARPWLVREDENVESALAELLGAGGEAFDEDAHMQVALAAVQARASTGGVNDGFVRDEVPLGIVIVTDTDDQSLQGGQSGPIDAALAALDTLKGGETRAWAVAVIAGARNPRCVSDLGEASYASGLAAFVEAAGDDAAFGSLCAGDLSPPLGLALGTLLQMCASLELDGAGP